MYGDYVESRLGEVKVGKPYATIRQNCNEIAVQYRKSAEL